MIDLVAVKFRTAFVEMDQYNIWSTFNDGKVNHFYIPGNNRPEYMEAVKLYGYGEDWQTYAREHELAHHFIADNLGWKWSWSLHSSAGKTGGAFPAQWPNHIEWEENVVNAFQAYCRARITDPWNTLHLVFPRQKLDDKRLEFLRLAELVLDKRVNVFYNHNNGTITEERVVNEPILFG